MLERSVPKPDFNSIWDFPRVLLPTAIATNFGLHAFLLL
ncbi:hypothetical protein PMI03_04247 [Rhizobium sp. AP16]|nr:hypothetical protein PMI03_04247 [Rhizobium sp. AP16]